MSINIDYLDYVLDQLQCVGEVVAKKMFGGAGIYLDGIFFALIANNVLYFKVDSSNKLDYETAGMEPFRPRGKKSYAMQYYEVPVSVLEDKEKLKVWANKALDVAIKNV